MYDFIVFCRYNRVLYKLKVWQLCICTILLRAFAHLMSVSYLLIFKAFPNFNMSCMLWWSVINSLCYCWNCCYYCNEQLGLCPWNSSFIDKCICSDHTTHRLCFPCFSSPPSLYFLITIIFEIRPMDNLTVACKWSRLQRRLHLFALTQNLKMIALTEEEI